MPLFGADPFADLSQPIQPPTRAAGPSPRRRRLFGDDPFADLAPKSYVPPEDDSSFMSNLLSGAQKVLAAPARVVDVATNYYAGGPLRDRVLSGGEPVPTAELAAEALFPKEEAKDSYGKSVGRAATRLATNVLADPLNAIPAGIMARGGGRVAGALMGGLMAKGAYDSGKETLERVQAEGWTPATVEAATETGLAAGMAGLGIKHALSPHVPKVGTERPILGTIEEADNDFMARMSERPLEPGASVVDVPARQPVNRGVPDSYLDDVDALNEAARQVEIERRAKLDEQLAEADRLMERGLPSQRMEPAPLPVEDVLAGPRSILTPEEASRQPGSVIVPEGVTRPEAAPPFRGRVALPESDAELMARLSGIERAARQTYDTETPGPRLAPKPLPPTLEGRPVPAPLQGWDIGSDAETMAAIERAVQESYRQPQPAPRLAPQARPSALPEGGRSRSMAPSTSEIVEKQAPLFEGLSDDEIRDSPLLSEEVKRALLARRGAAREASSVQPPRPASTDQPAAPESSPEKPPTSTPPVTEAPTVPQRRYAYRARDVGERGVPGGGHSQASLSEADVRNIAPSRTENPQEVVRVDLSKLKEGEDYVIHERPGAEPWVQFLKPLDETIVEHVGPVTDADIQAASKAEPPLREAVERTRRDVEGLAQAAGLTPEQAEKGIEDVKADAMREFSPEAVTVKRTVLTKPTPGNVKPPTIYQPEGSHFSNTQTGGRTQVVEPGFTERQGDLIEQQAALLGPDDLDNPLIAPEVREALRRRMQAETKPPEPPPEEPPPTAPAGAAPAPPPPPPVSTPHGQPPVVDNPAAAQAKPDPIIVDPYKKPPRKPGVSTMLEGIEFDENKLPIFPGQETWSPTERKAVHTIAQVLVDEVASADRPRGGKVFVRGGETGNAVEEVLGVKSAKTNTPLEGLPYTPSQMKAGLRRDKGNIIEADVMQAAARDPRVDEVIDYMEREARGGGDEDTSFDFGANLPPTGTEPKYAVRPSPGQRGFEGIAEDVAPAKEKAKAPEQRSMFGGEMLHGVEKNVPEGREANGPLFGQEKAAREKAAAEAQRSLPEPQPAYGRVVSESDGVRVLEGTLPLTRGKFRAEGRGEASNWEDTPEAARAGLQRMLEGVEAAKRHATETAAAIERAKAGKATDYDMRVLTAGRRTLTRNQAEGLFRRLGIRGKEGETLARRLPSRIVASGDSITDTDIVFKRAAEHLAARDLKFNADKSPTATGITTATVERAFKGSTVKEVKPGEQWHVTLPNGRQIRVDMRGEIAYQPEAFKAGYGREIGGEEKIVGSYNRIGRDAIIQLAKEGADEGTLRHESFHDAMAVALTEKERAAVLKHYGDEEKAADAYAKWKPKETTHTLFSKIRDFFRNIYRAFKPSAESTFEKVHSGRAFERTGSEGPVREAFATAFHGSPHDFDRFDSSKIGTGEGAQAYGHGLYFAGNKEVAEHYRQSLGGPDYQHVDPSQLATLRERLAEKWSPEVVARAQSMLDRTKGDVHKAIGVLRNVAEQEGNVQEANIGRMASNMLMREISPQGGMLRAEKKRGGKMYEVDLKPSEDEYLYWDKPLSEQSEKVRAGLESLGLNADADGKWAYQKAAKLMGAAKASEYLRSRGIPGIKFLDGSSRGKGEGSYNYVIFDDSLIETKAKYATKKKDEGVDSFAVSPKRGPGDKAANPESAPGGGTNSEAFRRWFGDSKIVDNSGQPLRVYHGGKDFESFERTNDIGFHFGSKEAAKKALKNKKYKSGGVVREFFLSIKNPVEMPDLQNWRTLDLLTQLKQLGIVEKDVPLADFAGRAFDSGLTPDRYVVKLLKDAGYDGIKYTNVYEGRPEWSYMAFDPTQIKATDNRGSFDPTDPRVKYATAPAKQPGKPIRPIPDKVEQSDLPGVTDKARDEHAQMYQRVSKQFKDAKHEVSEGFRDRWFQTDPADKRAITELLRAERNPKWKDYAYEAWINGLLSGPPTHFANAIGNALTQVLRVPEKAVAGALDAARSKVTGKARERYVGEAYADLMGVKQGVLKAVSILKNGLREDTFDGGKVEHLPSIPGKAGEAIRTPTRLLSAMDNAFKAVAETREAHSQAYRKARSEGLKAHELKGRMAEILGDLTKHPDILEAMKAEAAYQTFTKEVGPAATKARELRDELHMGVIVPFFNTPLNIAKYTLERTPLNFIRLAEKYASGKLKDGELASELAKPLIGTLIGVGLAAAAKDGYLTGSGPADERKKALLRKTGWQPYSLKLGKQYVSFQRFEPLSSIAGFAADLVEAKDEDERKGLVNKIVGSITENLTNKTFLQGVENVALVYSDPTRYAGQMAKQLEGSLVPALVGRAAQAVDSTQRETSPLDGSAVLGRIPFASMLLEPRRSGTGEVEKRQGTGIERFLSPAPRTEEKGREADLEREFLAADYTPSRPSSTVANPYRKGAKVDLTSEELRLFREQDERATERLRRIIRAPAWRQLSPEQKQSRMRQIYGEAGRLAKQRVYRSSAFRQRAKEGLRERA